jgi:hypothetical protein
MFTFFTITDLPLTGVLLWLLRPVVSGGLAVRDHVPGQLHLAQALHRGPHRGRGPCTSHVTPVYMRH